MTKIFLLEDNSSLGKSLVERLGEEGYQVEWASNLAEGRSKLSTFPAKLAIVDVSLPDGSGIDFTRSELKPIGVPVIFLSAFSTAEYRLEGFDAGGIDYIPKPFHLRELLIRVKRALENEKNETKLKVGDVTVHLDSHSVTNEAGESHFLAPRDFELLKFLIEMKPQVISREDIANKIWKDEGSSNFRTIDNAIVRVRQALGEKGAASIRSVRGIGYQWVE